MSRTDRPDPDPREGGNPIQDFRRRFALWNNLSFWRQWALGGSLAALALLAVVVLDRPGSPHYVAVLQSGEDDPAWLVSANTEGNVLSIRPVAALKPDGKSYWLWLIPDRGRPRPLGAIGSSGETTIPIDIDLARAISGAAAFGVSLEPAGGPPTGMPTGALLFLGKSLSVTR